MNPQWRTDTSFNLLENGEAYFPRVIEAIGQAREEVLIETFILFEDEVGNALREALIAAARRGVSVDVTVDGYGSDGLSAEFLQGLVDSGVRFHLFDPKPRLMGVRTNLFRRLHRKIVAIDDTLAFIGGINFSVDHLLDSGPQAKQDYAVEIRGKLASDIARYARAALATPTRWPSGRRHVPPVGRCRVKEGTAALVVRDNDRHRDDIERHYRAAIRAARRDILIANAYFFPGYGLLRELKQAARRGVRVRLILQGEPDMPVAKMAASMLYDYLTDGGVEIHEYCTRPLHGKVACIDDSWVTVGSSNLDPFSLALNLEANVFACDTGLNAALRERLDHLLQQHCQLAPRSSRPARNLRRLWVGVFVFHFLRRFPAWAGALPAHKPKLQSVDAAVIEALPQHNESTT
ncbi:cardiolipin synthase ClsB [Bordetella genomosp. 13]|uniref:Cardiolipin synthase B n=1 Tax=Bordetella genomosp. 13 TaxID=463040 RepID=A0A1W6ZA81_9BORD|nr:cardiolipin synthase ClsB [Bordetella genomosp. 13]ARP94152.1 cardiolipin synthase B [Bordetella genomosp. 13]